MIMTQWSCHKLILNNAFCSPRVLFSTRNERNWISSLSWCTPKENLRHLPPIGSPALDFSPPIIFPEQPQLEQEPQESGILHPMNRRMALSGMREVGLPALFQVAVKISEEQTECSDSSPPCPYPTPCSQMLTVTMYIYRMTRNNCWENFRN